MRRRFNDHWFIPKIIWQKTRIDIIGKLSWNDEQKSLYSSLHWFPFSFLTSPGLFVAFRSRLDGPMITGIRVYVMVLWPSARASLTGKWITLDMSHKRQFILFDDFIIDKLFSNKSAVVWWSVQILLHLRTCLDSHHILFIMVPRTFPTPYLNHRSGDNVEKSKFRPLTFGTSFQSMNP